MLNRLHDVFASFPNLSQRERELLEGIAQASTFEGQDRYHSLNRELEHRTLTADEQAELQELIRHSEAQTGQRLTLLLLEIDPRAGLR